MIEISEVRTGQQIARMAAAEVDEREPAMRQQCFTSGARYVVQCLQCRNVGLRPGQPARAQIHIRPAATPDAATVERLKRRVAMSGRFWRTKSRVVAHRQDNLERSIGIFGYGETTGSAVIRVHRHVGCFERNRRQRQRYEGAFFKIEARSHHGSFDQPEPIDYAVLRLKDGAGRRDFAFTRLLQFHAGPKHRRAL